jgi:epoxyqueuosine reductase
VYRYIRERCIAFFTIQRFKIILVRREAHSLNIKTLKEEIIAYSKEIGIDKIGFTTADTFTELKNRLIRQQELNYHSGFEEPDINKRVTPSLLLEEPRSIISIAIAYPSKMNTRLESKKGERRGIFSRASWGLDYHHVLNDAKQTREVYLNKNTGCSLKINGRYGGTLGPCCC